MELFRKEILKPIVKSSPGYKKELTEHINIKGSSGSEITAMMKKQLKFSVGDGVSAISGPMQWTYGTVVFYDEVTGKYLVRYTEEQQLYFAEEEITAWKNVK